MRVVSDEFSSDQMLETAEPCWNEVVLELALIILK